MKTKTTLLLTLFCAFSMLAAVSPSEKEALVKLYESTNGKQWKVKWDLTAPVSTWFGVKLLNDKVVAIQLADNNLIGELPAEISNLESLQELDLHKNQITGSIPAAVGELKQMQVLNLSFNKLQGSIPNAICELNNLKKLELYMNGLWVNCLKILVL